MTNDEAIEESKLLADLFPKSNGGTIDFWSMIFLRFAPEIIRKSILAYREQCNSDFIDKTEFMAMIQNLAKGGPIGIVAANVSAARSESAEKMRRIRDQERAAEESFRPVNGVLDRLTEDQLRELQRKAIEQKPYLAQILKKSDPAKSPVLRSLMAGLVK